MSLKDMKTISGKFTPTGYSNNNQETQNRKYQSAMSASFTLRLSLIQY